MKISKPKSALLESFLNWTVIWIIFQFMRHFKIELNIPLSQSFIQIFQNDRPIIERNTLHYTQPIRNYDISMFELIRYCNKTSYRIVSSKRTIKTRKISKHYRLWIYTINNNKMMENKSKDQCILWIENEVEKNSNRRLALEIYKLTGAPNDASTKCLFN